MEQAYLYTLSSIAQAFAALIALSAIFVVYKLQVLKEEHVSLVSRIRFLTEEAERMSTPTSCYPNVLASALARIQSLPESELLTRSASQTRHAGVAEQKDDVLRRMAAGDAAAGNIRSWLRGSLVLNGGVVLGSLVLLPFRAIRCPALHWVLLAVSILFAAVALAATIVATVRTAEDQAPDAGSAAVLLTLLVRIGVILLPPRRSQ